MTPIVHELSQEVVTLFSHECDVCNRHIFPKEKMYYQSIKNVDGEIISNLEAYKIGPALHTTKVICKDCYK